MRTCILMLLLFFCGSALADRAVITCSRQAHEQQLRGVYFENYMRDCIPQEIAKQKDAWEKERATLGPAHTATKAQIETMRAAMETMLKDADSAKFLEVRTRSKPDGGTLVCGKVNSKNSYGAYSGFTAFTATLHGHVATIDKIDSTDTNDAAFMCSAMM